jgi:hypothetical protein
METDCANIVVEDCLWFIAAPSIQAAPLVNLNYRFWSAPGAGCLVFVQDTEYLCFVLCSAVTVFFWGSMSLVSEALQLHAIYYFSMLYWKQLL